MLDTRTAQRFDTLQLFYAAVFEMSKSGKTVQ
jgi:hypothetical protein